jgi:hypothetical protein
LIPARREPSQLLLNELQLVHDLFEVVAGLGGLRRVKRSGSRSDISLASGLEYDCKWRIVVNARLPCGLQCNSTLPTKRPRHPKVARQRDRGTTAIGCRPPSGH